jgi:LCP family protein required for cell wall assembly
MAAGPDSLRPRLRRSWPQRLLIVTGVLLTIACVAAASGVGYVYWKFGELTHYHDVKVEAAPPGEPQNYLIVGSDSRDNIDAGDPNSGAFLGDTVAGKRSDTIMVVRIDPKANTAALLSFPRDLWVPIAGSGSERINTAYGKGRQVLIDTIKQDFGVSINHYIEVDFRGFQGVVNAIGGVPMYFDTPMRDSNSGLNIRAAGCTTLDGEQALAFARSRHLQFKDKRGHWVTDPTGDLGRITRQQLFVRQVMSRALATGITQIGTLRRLLDVAVKNVGVDAGLDTGDLLNLAQRFKTFTPDKLQTYSIPGIGFRTNAGASVLKVDQAGAEPMLNIFRGLPPGTVSEQSVSVTVLNGSGVLGQAADSASALETVGFNIASTGNFKAGTPRTTIRYAPGSEGAADVLVRHLTSGADLVADPTLRLNRVTLVTGQDFTTVMRQPLPPNPNGPTTTTTVAPPTTAATGSSHRTTTTTVPPSTTTTEIGRVPGEPPAGVTC